ncbi:MAG: hypothetical protein ACKPKO_27170, partial [Candidatus Fonsibacter sp.]
CISSSLMYLKPFVRYAFAYMFRRKRLLPLATTLLVYIMGAPSMPWLRGLSGFHSDLSSYCLMKVMSPPYLSWNNLASS